MEDKVEKKVESYIGISSIEFEILKYLTQFLTITQIAKFRKTSRAAVYKQISRLLEKGFIRKIGKAFRVTDLGNRGLHSLIGFRNQVRLHDLAVKVRLLKRPRNWDLKRSKLAQIRVLSKQVDIKNNSYQIHPFSNIKIKTTTNSIIFYLPTTYGKNTDEAFKQSLDLLWKSIPQVEQMFNIYLIKDKHINFEIISQHYAKLNDSLAKLYRREGKKLYITNDEGKVWLIADLSFRVDELETIDTLKAKEDMDIVRDFFNDLRKNPATITEVLNLVRENSANNVALSMNFKSHIKAIQELGKGVNALVRVVGDIKEENKRLKLGKQKTLKDF